MGKNVALDWESISKDVSTITECANNLVNSVDKAIKKTEELRVDQGVEDATVTAIVTKLSNSYNMVKDIPDMMDELSRNLKSKSEALEEATTEAMRGILGDD